MTFARADIETGRTVFHFGLLAAVSRAVHEQLLSLITHATAPPCS